MNDWRAVLGREMQDRRADHEPAVAVASSPYAGERIAFPIVESD
jgi:hypothetical protein